MVIDQAIVDRAGRILISRNTVLDAYHIMSLIKMAIPGVYMTVNGNVMMTKARKGLELASYETYTADEYEE